MTTKRALLIVNPRAGKVKNTEVITDYIKTEFGKCGTEVDVRYTTCKGDATVIAEDNAGKYDFYICCGGDGTFSETISGIMQMDEKVPIGYIPTGSTNDMAKTLNLPKDFKQATHVCAAGVPTAHDVGVFNEEMYFAYIASFGAFTEVSYSTSQKMKNNFGHFAYIIGGVRQIPHLRSYNVTVRANGEEFTGDILFGSVSNTLSFAGLFSFNKEDVSLSDGEFEVLLVKKPTGAITLGRTVHGMLHKKYEKNNIILLHAKEVEFVFNSDVPEWSLDGEHCSGRQRITARAAEKTIEIIR